MPFSKSNASELSETDLVEVRRAVKRIKTLLRQGQNTFAQEILEPNMADSPNKVMNAIMVEFPDWKIQFIPDSRDGNYYLFS